MFHWFDEAQFNEQGEFIYTYVGMGDIIATTLMMTLFLITLFRLALTFRNYVYTGEFGDSEISVVVNLMENEKLNLKYLFIGYHPGGIAADLVAGLLLSLMSVGLWGLYLGAGLTVLLATTMRKRIAHKQEFIGNLKGNQHEE